MTTAMDYREAMKVAWPAHDDGTIRIGTFTVSEEAAKFEQMRVLFSGGRGTPAGTYTGLWINGSLWMSDAPDEQADHADFVRSVVRNPECRRVLVTGLGLGMVVRALCLIPHVERVDVIEQHSAVVAAMSGNVTRFGADNGTEVVVTEGDAYTGWRLLGGDWSADAAWHDLWPTICGDNWDEMKRIKRAWRARVTRQDCWLEDMCKRHAQRSNRRQGWW